MPLILKKNAEGNYIMGCNNFINPLTVIPGYFFRLKGSSSTMPTKDATNTYAITNTGTSTNLVTMYNDATRGYVFNFNGSAWLSLPTTNINYSTGNSVTITFWVKVSAFNSVVFAYTYSACMLWMQNSTTLANLSGNNSISFTTTTGQWYNYAIIFTSTNTSLYINGSLVTSFASSGSNSNNTWQIGTWASGNSNFNGYMDDFRIYNTTLTLSQITSIYNGTG